MAPLPTDQAGFVSVEAHESNGAITPTSFDPFPPTNDDPRAAAPRGTFNRDAHAFSVLEQINRARTNPKGYVSSRRTSAAATPGPPSRRGRTRHRRGRGRPAGSDRHSEQDGAVGRPPPRRPMSECSQQLADEIAAAATAATPRTSGGRRRGRRRRRRRFSERLLARGKWRARRARPPPSASASLRQSSRCSCPTATPAAATASSC